MLGNIAGELFAAIAENKCVELFKLIIFIANFLVLIQSCISKRAEYWAVERD